MTHRPAPLAHPGRLPKRLALTLAAALLPMTAPACDNLRMNYAAHRNCVNNHYDVTGGSSRPAYLSYEYWDRRARETAEREAATARTRVLVTEAPQRRQLAQAFGEARGRELVKLAAEGKDLSWGWPLEPEITPPFEFIGDAGGREHAHAPARAEQERLHAEGRHAEAVEAGRKAIASQPIFTDNFEGLRARMFLLLGQSLAQVGDRAEADKAFEQAWAILRRDLSIVHGSAGDNPFDHGAALEPRRAIAAYLEGTGRCAEAQPHRDAAVRITERILGLASPQTARALEEPANNQSCRGLVAAATASYERALAIWTRVPQDFREGASGALVKLSSLHLRQGQPGNGIDALRQALGLRESLHGASHPQVAQTRLALAKVLRDSGQGAEADALDPPPPPPRPPSVAPAQRPATPAPAPVKPARQPRASG